MTYYFTVTFSLKKDIITKKINKFTEGDRAIFFFFLFGSDTRIVLELLSDITVSWLFFTNPCFTYLHHKYNEAPTHKIFFFLLVSKKRGQIGHIILGHRSQT